MNVVILKGNLARDPEKREVSANGRMTTVVNFTVAVSRFFNQSDGSKGKDTTFINCEAWDTGAETIAKYLKKGEPILVKGSLKTETWDDKETGKKRSVTKVRVERFERLYRSNFNKDEDSEAGVPVDENEVNTPDYVGADDGEDIPF